LGWIAVFGALAGVVLHGAGRIFTNGKNGNNNKTNKNSPK
jgi:hypothetical protein